MHFAMVEKYRKSIQHMDKSVHKQRVKCEATINFEDESNFSLRHFSFQGDSLRKM